ncbi:MAG TPA: RluA family pseudouridine synthase [bacterium]|nr:RluA family pseudouridine synthase [bacterium]
MDRLAVLYEDEWLLVVDKPAGMHCAPLHAGDTGTLLHLVLERYPAVASVPGLKPLEPGLVHRIDSGTSGAVVVARTPRAFEALRQSFNEPGTVKTYRAACAAQDRRPGDTLTVESRFAPLGEGRRRVRVVLPDDPRAARRGATRTVYRTGATVDALREGRALVSAVISRGFRHQVRAHLAFRGLPIFGDPLYGVAVPPGAEDRMYLHAWRVQMRHPDTGAPLVVESALPPCFARLLEGGEP